MGKDRKGGGTTQVAAQAEQVERDLAVIRRALRKPFEAMIAQGELTVPQTAVMREVVAHDGVSLKDLSGAVSLAHSTVSGIVDRLEARGMISRRADSKDGRISRIYPSAEVAEFVRTQIPALSRGPLQRALERATEAERIQIAKALRRMRELLEESG
ncbi:MAG TPA: MarR family winged helix-turn-helix transcriptional regulator [Terracidiphilus sp.]|nr:MarR family winged helix-turn-helix transcriptional regulator [Terracidiphilus sp.]